MAIAGEVGLAAENQRFGGCRTVSRRVDHRSSVPRNLPYSLNALTRAIRNRLRGLSRHPQRHSGCWIAAGRRGNPIAVIDIAGGASSSFFTLALKSLAHVAVLDRGMPDKWLSEHAHFMVSVFLARTLLARRRRS